MQMVRGELNAPLCVTSALAVHGTVAGPITVMSDGELVFRGICNGDITVASGGKAEVWGIVKGNVINQGGTLHIAGAVDGYVDRAAGRTTHAPDLRPRRGFRT